MRYNNKIIESSEILTTIIRNIENKYPNDVSVLLCYGSYVNNCSNKLSDIDFCFIPKNDKGKANANQFIIDGIGYDLWPISWELLESMVLLDNSFGSILMDGKVLYAASEEDVAKIDKMRNDLKHKLHNEKHSRLKARQYIEKAKIHYYDSIQSNPLTANITAQKAIENVVTALAIMNNEYLRKGLKSISTEMENYKIKINDFHAMYTMMIKTEDVREISTILYTLISELEGLWKQKYAVESSQDLHELEGFYEEFKSTYNKLIYECQEENYEKAYYAAYLIDKETLETLESYLPNTEFPSMIMKMKERKYKDVMALCKKHEQILLDELKDAKVEIKTYKEISDFVNDFKI